MEYCWACRRGRVRVGILKSIDGVDIYRSLAFRNSLIRKLEIGREKEEQKEVRYTQSFLTFSVELDVLVVLDLNISELDTSLLLAVEVEVVLVPAR